MPDTLIVLIGPTGVGKTELSLSIAEHFRTSIVSADSRQLYADLKIGTAAPTPEQLARVPHYFVGTLQLTDYYSAAQYEADVLAQLEILYQNHNKNTIKNTAAPYNRCIEPKLAYTENPNDASPPSKSVSRLPQTTFFTPILYGQIYKFSNISNPNTNIPNNAYTATCAINDGNNLCSSALPNKNRITPKIKRTITINSNTTAESLISNPPFRLPNSYMISPLRRIW